MTVAPIFIVGCPRSGTTLLRDLLRSHENVGFPTESHFIPEYYRAYGDPKTPQDAVRLANRILSFPWVQTWQLPLVPDDFRDCRRFRDVLSLLYGTWAEREGKLRWGDKTPEYVVEIPLLLRIFPGAKIVHIIRDGRDVASSWVATGFHPKNLYVASRLWKRNVIAGREAGVKLPTGVYLEVFYESLLERPEETMRTVCKHIDEPFSESLLRPNRIPAQWRQRVVPGRQRPAANDRIATWNVARWKRKMSIPDRTLVESVSGDLLAELDYETENRTRKISGLEMLLWESHHFCARCCRLISNLHRARFISAVLKTQWTKLRSQIAGATSRRSGT